MKPILFNTKMVQAILDGRKTTTRRIARGLKDATKATNGDFKWDYKQSWMNDLGLEISAPYHIGDILYVRETWMIQSMKNFEKNIKFLYKAGPQELKEVHVSNQRYEDMLKFESKNGWQPSLFMPKEAARIFLKVTDVRVERLQDISEVEALKEGAQSGMINGPSSARFDFQEIWDKTVNKKDIDKYGWNANPWVWVIEFENR